MIAGNANVRPVFDVGRNGVSPRILTPLPAPSPRDIAAVVSKQLLSKHRNGAASQRRQNSEYA